MLDAVTHSLSLARKRDHPAAVRPMNAKFTRKCEISVRDFAAQTPSKPLKNLAW